MQLARKVFETCGYRNVQLGKACESLPRLRNVAKQKHGIERILSRTIISKKIIKSDAAASCVSLQEAKVLEIA